MEKKNCVFYPLTASQPAISSDHTQSPMPCDIIRVLVLSVGPTPGIGRREVLSCREKHKIFHSRPVNLTILTHQQGRSPSRVRCCHGASVHRCVSIVCRIISGVDIRPGCHNQRRGPSVLSVLRIRSPAREISDAVVVVSGSNRDHSRLVSGSPLGAKTKFNKLIKIEVQFLIYFFEYFTRNPVHGFRCRRKQ